MLSSHFNSGLDRIGADRFIEDVPYDYYANKQGEYVCSACAYSIDDVKSWI